MDGQPSIVRWLVGFAGVFLILLAMCDVFMTVLFARAASGPVSHRLGQCLWAIARRLGRAVPRYKTMILGFCGPVLMVLLMGTWIAMLLLGFTLLAWPNMGTGIASQSGITPRDFWSAFYFAGGSMTTVGSGDLRPVVPFFKFVCVIDSVLGI